MSATIEEIPYAVLHKITDRITHEVEGINRVLYVDGDYKILNTQDAARADEKNWISLNGKIQEVDLKTEVTFSDDKKTATVDSAEELVTLANAINDKKSDVKEVTTITLAAGEKPDSIDYNGVAIPIKWVVGA
jgi:hypothetical protein